MKKYFLIMPFVLLIFCTGCNKNNDTIISKNPCVIEIKDTYTTVYKKPQYESTINNEGYLVDDIKQGKVKKGSSILYYKNYIKGNKWVEYESVDTKTPYFTKTYNGKNIYLQAINNFITVRVTDNTYTDKNGTKLEVEYPKAKILFNDEWKSKNLLTPYSIALVMNNKDGNLIKKDSDVNGIKCDLYGYGPNKICNKHHCTNYNAEVCYNNEYDMAINIKIISKTDINDKYYNVDKSIQELAVTKLEFTDIPDSKFKKPKGLILPDILFKKLM